MDGKRLRIALLLSATLLVAGCGALPKLDEVWPFKRESTPVAEPTGTVAEPVSKPDPAAAKPAPKPAPAPPSVPAPAAVQIPVVAAAYSCEGRQQIHVRPLEGGAVWLTLPERELRLEKSPSALNRYGAGRVTLELGEGTASVEDPPATYSGCKVTTGK